MSLISLKTHLQKAKDAQPPSMAKRRHMRRALAAGVIAVSLGLFGVMQWNQYKGKAELINNDPYSVEAIIAKYPEKAKLYASASPYSLKLDSLARGLLSSFNLRESHDAVINDTVIYPFTILASRSTYYLNYKDVVAIIDPYTLGGAKNQANLSKVGLDSVVDWFQGAGSSPERTLIGGLFLKLYDESPGGKIVINGVQKLAFTTVPLTFRIGQMQSAGPFKIRIVGICNKPNDNTNPFVIFDLLNSNRQVVDCMKIVLGESHAFAPTTKGERLRLQVNNVTADPIPEQFRLQVNEISVGEKSSDTWVKTTFYSSEKKQ